MQSPQGTRDDIAKTLGISPDNVTVNVTLLGGGFGRKSKCDFALEAAILSKAVGAPVKVQWTREDDIQHDFLHTVSAERIEAGLDKGGKVIAWRHRSVAPTILSTFVAGAKHQAPFELGMGLVDVPFDIPNIRCENPRGRRLYPHRLVPLGVEHTARLRRADDGCRTCPGHGARPEGHVAGADRPGADCRYRAVRQGLLGLWRAASAAIRSMPGGCARWSNWFAEGPMGTVIAERPWAGHRGASQLRQLRRDHRGGRGGRQG